MKINQCCDLCKVRFLTEMHKKILYVLRRFICEESLTIFSSYNDAKSNSEKSESISICTIPARYAFKSNSIGLTNVNQSSLCSNAKLQI